MPPALLGLLYKTVELVRNSLFHGTGVIFGVLFFGHLILKISRAWFSDVQQAGDAMQRPFRYLSTGVARESMDVFRMKYGTEVSSTLPISVGLLVELL